MITYKQGNILEATEDIISHQCNSLSVMGSGLAKQIRDKYPIVFKEYSQYCNRFINKSDLLGKLQVIKTDSHLVANLFGQLGYGRDKQHTDYEALESSLWKLKTWAKSNNLSVAIPYKIGSDRGGGDWSVVLEIIETVFEDYNVSIYQYKG